jgi:dTDP-4-amino-4,6-dideoxygalactose transaminase
MSVPLLDFSRQHKLIGVELERAAAEVIRHGKFINGPEVAELESKVAALCGDDCIGVGVASGTDALLLSLRAAGVGEGDEVILPAFSFISSASVIMLLNARPVFVDIDPETYNIDPERFAAAISGRTKAVIPVHLFGQCAEMDDICDIALQHNLMIIEDAAQAIGAGYKDKKAGAIGDFGCFSFYPTKNLGAAGDGGMVVVKNQEFADTLKMLRSHGWKKKYNALVVGYNSRLDTIQAALLLVKLKYLDNWTKQRQANAAYYDRNLTGIPLKTPVCRDDRYHIYNQYTIAVENRDELIAALEKNRIGYEIYYPFPFHLLESYKSLNYRRGDFPNAEKASAAVLSLPIYPELTRGEQDQVIEVIRSICR